jgi:predicted dehydrogenase
MALRVGVIGAGTHGTRYLRHLRNDVPGLTAVGLCRRDAAAGRALADELGLRYYPETAALVADPEVDAVVVCTPPASHFSLARRALEAHKPLLVEKPLTGTLREARRLAKLDAAGSAPPLMVAQTLRWNPVVQAVRELWPQLGRVHLIRLAQRLEPTSLAWQRQLTETVGGSVLLTGVHLFDLACHLTGCRFTQVASVQRQILNPVVEDLFVARGELEGGTWVSLEVSKYTRSRAGWLEAVGEAGQLHADYLHGCVELRCEGKRHRRDVAAAVPTLPPVLAAWRDALAAGVAPPVTVGDGLHTLEVTEACYRSTRSGGRTVSLSELE